MADRYWLGINGTWTTTGNWSTAAPLSLTAASCSGTTLTTTGSPALVIGMTVWSASFVSLGTITGGSGDTWTVSLGGTYASQTMIAATTGATAPTAADNVFFTTPSSGYTVSLSGSLACNDLSKSGSSITFTGTGTLAVSGSFNLSGITGWSTSGTITFRATTTGKTITTSGTTINPPVIFNGVGGGWTLGDAFTSANTITLTNGTFGTNNYAVSALSFTSDNSNARIINFGSSTLNFSSGNPITFTNSTGLTFNAGTSQINCSSVTPVFAGGGNSFYNVSFTATAYTTITIVGDNTFNNVTTPPKAVSGSFPIIFASNQIINGVLTIGASSAPAVRPMLLSDVIGTRRTLTCASVATIGDVDFRDIQIAGTAAPISGTRLGDCKNNLGITFTAGANKYWVGGNLNWSSNAWALTSGGAANLNNYPLAQDTAIFGNSFPASAGVVTINTSYNICTVDMSARTVAMTFATASQTQTIYGNWINGPGTTLTGTGAMTFSGQNTQTITSAGKPFSQAIRINSPGGSVVLQDAITLSYSNTGVLSLTAGTFDANNYNVTLSGVAGTFSSNNSNTRTVAIGSGTWTINGNGTPWQCTTATNLTVTGTGTISLTSASAKGFAGGGIQTYPTLNQGGTGALTVSGSNKFANITNTAIGSVLFTGGTTNEFTDFNLNGTSKAARLTLGSTTTTQAILEKPSAWFMGVDSLNSGNNTGLTFDAGGGIDFLAVSYINGQVTAPTVTYSGNFFAFF